MLTLPSKLEVPKPYLITKQLVCRIIYGFKITNVQETIFLYKPISLLIIKTLLQPVFLEILSL